MNKTNGRQFTDELKQEAFRLALGSGRLMVHIARELLY